MKPGTDRRHETVIAIGPPTNQQSLALAASTLAALERAGLLDIVDALRTRVLDRRPEEICDAVPAEGAGLRVSFKPIVELLLLEIKHVARAPHFTTGCRRARIDWAMTMAGV